MAIYCWGSTAHGQLGLGGIEEDQILTPREMDWSQASDISMLACGTMHTLLITKNGQVYSCGNNDHGQLGHDLSRKRPHLVSALDNYVVTQVACGASHSMALNEWGQLFTWGSNTCGQLAKDTNESLNAIPKIVKTLAVKSIVQIACGHYHSLVLTNSGELYSWGSNSYGQLGIGSICEKVLNPTQIRSLAGIPIAFIACGANHSFAISKSGAVFGWGKNLFGQLGLNDEKSRPYPTQLKTLRSLGVRYIACGDDFSVFLTSDGGVFTCGSGTYGQLGHGTVSNDFLPRMVVELMGTSCTQISCGRRHTLTFVPSRGRVYGFGLGSSGQLGHRIVGNSKVPQVVVGPWVSPSGTSLIDNCLEQNYLNAQPKCVKVKKIYSGGDHSFTLCCDQDAIPEDCRKYDQRTQISCLSLEIAKMCAAASKDDSLDSDLMSSVEILFKSLACFNASFLRENGDNLCCSAKFSGVNIALAQETFTVLRKIENETLKQLIWDGITNDLLNSLNPVPADVETLRIYLILPLYHEFRNSKNYLKLHSPFSLALLKLSELPQKCLSQWWATETNAYFEHLIGIFKGVVTHIINYNPVPGYQKRFITYEANMELALNVMQIFFRINHTLRKQKVSYELFQLPELTDIANLEHDYVNWLVNRNPNQFYLCNYPFIFDAKAKTLLLQTDQSIQMQSAMQSVTSPHSLFRLFTGQTTELCQYVMLNVSRENIVEDTIREIMRYGSCDLKKPLKVKFHGEEAEDAGGVRKEFFMLLLKDLLDPKYGMFKEFEDSRAIWFADYTFEDTIMFKLIGTLCGLAIYNFTIINLPFPLALYKKLLKEQVDLNDLHDLSPTLAKSLESLLDYMEPDFEDVFCLTFEISQNVFGETKTISLKPNGDKIPVTLDNKQEYADLYVDYILNKSVEKQFNEFYEGFMKVCGGRVMELFKPHELMAVVIGNEDYDWHALEAESQYKNGYTSSDPTIRWFWEVFHELPLSEKKKFLLFLTGSDRIPIQGMKAIRIYFQPINDERCLPVAHTCFNLLDLPRYNTKERLKYKLCQAIQQTQGFSIV